jgi:hypothetical protein
VTTTTFPARRTATMSKIKTRVVLTIEASNEQNAEKIKEVLLNVTENISENAFCNVLYPKIQKNPAFFEKVANNPLIKML